MESRQKGKNRKFTDKFAESAAVNCEIMTNKSRKKQISDNLKFGIWNLELHSRHDLSLDVFARDGAEMTAVVAVFRIVADKKIMSAFVDSFDSFDDLARLLDRMPRNDDIADRNLRRAIDQHDFAVTQRRVHRFSLAHIFMPRAGKNQRQIIKSGFRQLFHRIS